MSRPTPSPVPLAETFWEGDRCAAIRGTADVNGERRPVVAVSLGARGVAYFRNPHNDTWMSMVNRQGRGINPALLDNDKVTGFTPLYPTEAYAQGNWWATPTEGDAS